MFSTSWGTGLHPPTTRYRCRHDRMRVMDMGRRVIERLTDVSSVGAPDIRFG